MRARRRDDVVPAAARPRCPGAARELPGTAAFASLEALAAAGAEAVAISTPASTHTAVTEQALRLGLAVVCDKPFALDAEAALGTVQLRGRHGPAPRFRSPAVLAPTCWLSATQEDHLMAGRHPGAPGDTWGAEPQETWGTLYDGTASRLVPTEPGRWNGFHPAFARAVRDGAPVPVDPNDAVATARVLDAARISATTGAVAEVHW